MPDDRDLAVLAVLTDAQRRRVFDRVQAVPDSTVSEIAESLGVGRTLVTFHLGKLVEAGLVEVVAAQRRRGALGRPSQRYRLSGREVSATVPDRRYDLLAGVLLDGVAEHQEGERAASSAARAARRRGAQLAEGHGRGAAGSDAGGWERLEGLLVALGYAPDRQDATLVVRNCPFDKLRGEHTEQVCAVNLALAEGYLDGLHLAEQVRPRLRPCADSCCVVFDADRNTDRGADRGADRDADRA